MTLRNLKLNFTLFSKKLNRAFKNYKMADVDDIKSWKQSFYAWKGYANLAEKYNLYKKLENQCEWIDKKH